MAIEHHHTAHRVAWQTVTKVPQIAAIFWLVKLITTALGEAAADYWVVVINPYVAVIGGFLLLLVALIFSSGRKNINRQPIGLPSLWSRYSARWRLTRYMSSLGCHTSLRRSFLQ